MRNFKKLLSLKELRDGARYSQRDIAKAADVSTAVVSRWLNDEIDGGSLVTVRKLCVWLDCDIGDLVTVRGDKEQA